MIIIIWQVKSDGERISLFFFLLLILLLISATANSRRLNKWWWWINYYRHPAARFFTFIVLRLKPYTMGDKADVYCFPRCHRSNCRRNDNVCTRIQRTREIKIAEPAKLYNNNSNNNITTHNESAAALYIVCTTAKHTRTKYILLLYERRYNYIAPQ